MNLNDNNVDTIKNLFEYNTTLTILDLLNNNFTEERKKEFNIIKRRITIYI